MSGIGIPTRKFLDRLKGVEDVLPPLKRLPVDTLSPFFSISGSILRTKTLVEGGFEASFSELILPHLVLTFGPPLLANSLYQRFKTTQNDLIVYILGFLLSLFVHSNRILMYFIAEVPYVSRFLSLVKLKNSTENTFSMMTWIITSEIAGMCLNRLILKKKLKVKLQDVFTMVVMYSGTLFLRVYKLNDYYVIIVANIVPLCIKAVECLGSGNQTKRSARKTTGEETPRKKPTRKASLTAKLEKSK